MPSILLTAPAIEPLSLDEAKAFLRVDNTDEDGVIGALIAGSRIHIEAQTRRALITQSWRLSRLRRHRRTKRKRPLSRSATNACASSNRSRPGACSARGGAPALPM